MFDNIKLLINNQTVNNNSNVRIINSSFIVNWDYNNDSVITIDEYTGDTEKNSNIPQLGYTIRVADNDLNLGSDDFVGNFVSSNLIKSEDKFWEYRGRPLERGVVYYGQIKFTDELGNNSDWNTFSVLYNAIPSVSNINLSPSAPTVDDDLVLTYDFFDSDGDIESGTIIRWYKNNVYQPYFDNAYIIKSNFLQTGDSWAVDILPSDGYEYGLRQSSYVIEVTSIDNVVSYARISPSIITENSIAFTDCGIERIEEREDVRIKWFINGKLQSKYDNMPFTRLDIKPGDTINYNIKIGNNNWVSSEHKVVQYSNFSIYDIKIDGRYEPLEISTLSPVISWKVHKPYGKEINYTSIKIGTFYEADNIYSTVISGDKNFYQIPINILEYGRDYYISISASENNSFNDYNCSHFRVRGSRWQNNVENNNGWTIETLFKVANEGVFDKYKYQVVRFSDGARFGEIRLYNNKISFVSEEIIMSNDLDTSIGNILTIVGKEDAVKVYINRELFIDATDKFTQETNIKKIEIGNPLKEDFNVEYSYLNYTTNGDFHPQSSSEYSNFQFHKYLEFLDNEIVALKGYSFYKVFATNPDSEIKNGKIYQITYDSREKYNTINRTFSPINNIGISPDGKKVGFAHSKGASVISGYVINPYNFEVDFTESIFDVDGNTVYPYPDAYGWDLVKNINFDAAYFNSSGLNINTIDRE